MRRQHISFTVLMVLCLLAIGCAKRSLQTQPDAETPDVIRSPDEDTGLDPRDELAAECFANAQVRQFKVSPTVVAPFTSTRVSWEVSAPANCRMSVAVGGKRMGLVDQLDFTPVRANSTVELQALALGASAVLARRDVAVDVSDCNSSVQISESQAQELLGIAIEEKDRESSKFDVIGNARTTITLEPRGLVIALPMRVFKTQSGARVHVGDVVLDMVLDFLVRNGTILPRYKLFQPNTKSVLDPGLDIGGTLTTEIRSAVFDQSDDILAALRTGLNNAAEERLANFPALQLFEIIPQSQQMSLTLCPIEVETEPEPEPAEPSLQECLSACDDALETCKSEGQLLPKTCVAIHKACVERCRE